MNAVGVTDPVAGLAVGGDARIPEIGVILAVLGSARTARSRVSTSAATRVRADQLGVVVGVASPLGGLAVAVGAGVVEVGVLVAVGVSAVAASACPTVGVVGASVATGSAAPGIFLPGAAGVGEWVFATDRSGCCNGRSEEKASELLEKILHGHVLSARGRATAKALWAGARPEFAR